MGKRTYMAQQQAVFSLGPLPIPEKERNWREHEWRPEARVEILGLMDVGYKHGRDKNNIKDRMPEMFKEALEMRVKLARQRG